MFETKVVEKINTHFMFSVFFIPENRPIYENMEKYCRTRQVSDKNIIRRMRFACWITKAPNTYSEYVILIVSRQQGLTKRASCCLTR